MKILVRLMAVGFSIFLFACASHRPTEYVWAKQGASEYDRVNALSECNYQIRLSKHDPEERQELLKLCMQGKGYRYVAADR